MKASFGRFVASQDGAGTRGLGRNNPVVRSVIEADRTWTDNGNFAMDCDLRNPLQNFECGQISNLNFGQNNPNALVYADELTTSLRPYHFETTAQVQRQIHKAYRSRQVTTAAISRTSRLTTIRSSPPVITAHYCVPEPVDDRLPGGGGGQICDFYDVSQAQFGKTAIVVRPDTDFGKGTQTYNGVDVTLQARLKKGVTFTGGLSTDKQTTNTCYVVDSPGAIRFCNSTTPILQYLHVHGFRAVTVGHGDWHRLSGSARTQNHRDPQLHER